MTANRKAFVILWRSRSVPFWPRHASTRRQADEPDHPPRRSTMGGLRRETGGRCWLCSFRTFRRCQPGMGTSYLRFSMILRRAGFKWDEFLTSQEIVPGEHPELRRLINAVVGPLPHIVAARTNLLNLKLLDRKFQEWHRALFSVDPNSLPASAVLDLRNAADRKHYDAYDQAYRRLAALHALGPVFDRRRLLLDRVRQVAPRWAAAIKDRVGPHGAGAPSGSVLIAWRWQQFFQELERRSSVSIADLQEKIHEVRRELRQVTTRLIELRSWSAQCKRVGLEERQALQGWKDIIRRIGRGIGQRAPGLRVEARRTLAESPKCGPGLDHASVSGCRDI